MVGAIVAKHMLVLRSFSPSALRNYAKCLHRYPRTSPSASTACLRRTVRSPIFRWPSSRVPRAALAPRPAGGGPARPNRGRSALPVADSSRLANAGRVTARLVKGVAVQLGPHIAVCGQRDLLAAAKRLLVSAILRERSRNRGRGNESARATNDDGVRRTRSHCDAAQTQHRDRAVVASGWSVGTWTCAGGG